MADNEANTLIEDGEKRAAYRSLTDNFSRWSAACYLHDLVQDQLSIGNGEALEDPVERRNMYDRAVKWLDHDINLQQLKGVIISGDIHNPKVTKRNFEQIEFLKAIFALVEKNMPDNWDGSEPVAKYMSAADREQYERMFENFWHMSYGEAKVDYDEPLFEIEPK